MLGTSCLAVGHCNALGAFPSVKWLVALNGTAAYGFLLHAHLPGTCDTSIVAVCFYFFLS